MPRLVAALAVLAVSGCAAASPDVDVTTDATRLDAGTPASGDWESLFDGRTLDGWHGYNRDDAPAGWSVEDGAIRFTPGGEGGDLMAEGTFEDFELELEWKVAACGNSGIFYTVEAAPELRAPWQTGLEMQVLDDTCHPDARYPSHRAGALYDLYVPTADVVRPAGTWNSARIVVRDGTIEHWLNGTRVVEARQGSPGWDARMAVSKFRDGDAFPAFGTRTSGAIGVQDHGDAVWFRAIRVRRL